MIILHLTIQHTFLCFRLYLPPFPNILDHTVRLGYVILLHCIIFKWNIIFLLI